MSIIRYDPTLIFTNIPSKTKTQFCRLSWVLTVCQQLARLRAELRGLRNCTEVNTLARRLTWFNPDTTNLSWICTRGSIQTGGEKFGISQMLALGKMAFSILEAQSQRVTPSLPLAFRLCFLCTHSCHSQSASQTLSRPT